MNNLNDIMRSRINLYQSIRDFFYSRKVSEVETPILSSYGTTDTYIDSLMTDWQGKPLYLHTSPEFFMKQLLVDGIGDCFQLCKVFRNETKSKYHNAEFTMLEWYRLNFSMNNLINEVAELFRYLSKKWHKLPMEIISYTEAFASFDINPHKDKFSILKQKIIKNLGYIPKLANNRNEWLDFFFVAKIERHLGKNKLTFLTHYPVSMAALAQIITDNDNNEVAERFELYYQGIELANGFHELTSADEQQARFIEDNRQRKKIGKPEVSIDTDFLAALKRGLPPCSGVALGIDRLLMIKLGLANINECVIPC